MDDATELLAALEAATGPNRDLDAEIWLLATPGAASGYLIVVPEFTASLDAALTLVPNARYLVIQSGTQSAPPPFMCRASDPVRPD